MAKPPTVLDVFCECLQIIQDLPPDDRPRVIAALDYFKANSLGVLKCPAPQALDLAAAYMHAQTEVPPARMGSRPLITGEGSSLVLTIRPGDVVSDSTLAMRFAELHIEPGASYEVASFYASRMTSGKIFVGGQELTTFIASNMVGEVEAIGVRAPFPLAPDGAAVQVELKP